MNDQQGAGALHRSEQASERIEAWRSHLLQLSAGLMPNIDEASFLGREMRAAATIAAMAELEALLRDMLVDIAERVNAAALEVRELAPQLRALASHSSFESLNGTADRDKIWVQRLELTQLDASRSIARLPPRQKRSPQPPLDGRTIQSRHISLVWNVLGLRQAIPRASVVASLKKLTQIRNDVAHRNIDILQVFSEAGRTALEIAGHLDDIVLLIIHIGTEWADYVDDERFRLANTAARS